MSKTPPTFCSTRTSGYWVRPEFQIITTSHGEVWLSLTLTLTLSSRTFPSACPATQPPADVAQAIRLCHLPLGLARADLALSSPRPTDLAKALSFCGSSPSLTSNVQTVFCNSHFLLRGRRKKVNFIFEHLFIRSLNCHWHISKPYYWSVREGFLRCTKLLFLFWEWRVLQLSVYEPQEKTCPSMYLESLHSVPGTLNQLVEKTVTIQRPQNCELHRLWASPPGAERQGQPPVKGDASCGSSGIGSRKETDQRCPKQQSYAQVLLSFWFDFESRRRGMSDSKCPEEGPESELEGECLFPRLTRRAGRCGHRSQAAWEENIPGTGRLFPEPPAVHSEGMEQAGSIHTQSKWRAELTSLLYIKANSPNYADTTPKKSAPRKMATGPYPFGLVHRDMTPSIQNWEANTKSKLKPSVSYQWMGHPITFSTPFGLPRYEKWRKSFGEVLKSSWGGRVMSHGSEGIHVITVPRFVPGSSFSAGCSEPQIRHKVCTTLGETEAAPTSLLLPLCPPTSYVTTCWSLKHLSSQEGNCYGLNVCPPAPQIHMLKF